MAHRQNGTRPRSASMECQGSEVLRSLILVERQFLDNPISVKVLVSPHHRQ